MSANRWTPTAVWIQPELFMCRHIMRRACSAKLLEKEIAGLVRKRRQASRCQRRYGFALAGHDRICPPTLYGKFAELVAETGRPLSPNLVVTLDGGILYPLVINASRHNPSIVLFVQEANGLYFVKQGERSFPFLLSRLQMVYREERTVGMAAYDRYWTPEDILQLLAGGFLHELSIRVLQISFCWRTSFRYSG